MRPKPLGLAFYTGCNWKNLETIILKNQQWKGKYNYHESSQIKDCTSDDPCSVGSENFTGQINKNSILINQE